MAYAWGSGLVHGNTSLIRAGWLAAPLPFRPMIRAVRHTTKTFASNEREQQLDDLVALLARLVDVDADEFRHVIGGQVLVAAVGVGHGGDLSGFLVGEGRAPLEPFEKIVRPVG